MRWSAEGGSQAERNHLASGYLDFLIVFCVSYLTSCRHHWPSGPVGSRSWLFGFGRNGSRSSWSGTLLVALEFIVITSSLTEISSLKLDITTLMMWVVWLVIIIIFPPWWWWIGNRIVHNILIPKFKRSLLLCLIVKRLLFWCFWTNYAH